MTNERTIGQSPVKKEGNMSRIRKMPAATIAVALVLSVAVATARDRPTQNGADPPQSLPLSNAGTPGAPPQPAWEPVPVARSGDPVPTAGAAAALYQIPWLSISADGGSASNAQYQIHVSVGQSIIGEASNSIYQIGVGHSYGAGAGCACDCHADPQCDALPDVFDIVHAVNVGFRDLGDIPDPSMLCPVVTTDVDCDGDTDVFDIVRFVNVAFRNEAPEDNFCDPCAP